LRSWIGGLGGVRNKYKRDTTEVRGAGWQRMRKGNAADSGRGRDSEEMGSHVAAPGIGLLMKRLVLISGVAVSGAAAEPWLAGTCKYIWE
jgi:hypothetical protein